MTPSQATGTLLLLAAILGGQDKTADENVTARIDASLTGNGAFHADILITGSGVRSEPYCDAFSSGKAGASAPTLFGQFMQNRRFQSAPQIIDADNLQRPVQIRSPVREDDLILPFQRQAPLALDFLPFRFTAAAQPDGSLPLGPPGKLREEITLTIPPEFALPRCGGRNGDRSFRSERKRNSRQLSKWTRRRTRDGRAM